MLLNESIWIGDTILKLAGHENLSLLNVGSSTLEFRTIVQPMIDDNIFRKLPRSISVVHLDMKNAPGVDMVGDLMDETFLASIREQFDIILCSNLLEHVQDPQRIINRLQEVVKPGGFLIISGPHRFPYHNDPIDTMFRPSVNELASMFTHCLLVDGKIISEAGSHWATVKANPRLALQIGARMMMPFYKFDNWRKVVRGIPDFFKHYQVVAVLLQKEK